MADNKYIYAVARIRALELGLLNDQFIEQLIATPDMESAKRLLAEKGWDEDLTVEEEKIWKTMKDLGVDMSIFDVITLPKLYHNLKTAIKAVISPGDYQKAFFDGTEIDKDKMLSIVKEKSWKELPEHMQKAAQEAYESFTANQDGQICDMLVDKACLEAIIGAANKSKEQGIRDYARLVVNVANVKIASRCARTGKSIDFIKKALAKGDSLNTDRLAKAAAGGMDSIIEYLRRDFPEQADALAKSPSAFESSCDNAIVELIRPQKTNPFTVGPLFAYALGRQNEIKTVRIVMAGKENGLPADAIRQRVRRMYG